MRAEYWAHSLEGRPSGEWHPLRAHLEAVAALAAQFAAAFGSPEWGRLAGLWHDLGKYLPDFQRKVAGEQLSVDHSVVGARLARWKNNSLGLPLAFVIAGHHAGLANWQSSEHGPTPLRERLGEAGSLDGMDVLPDIPRAILECELPALPVHLAAQGRQAGNQGPGLRRSAEFWTRFLYSALVDADFLNTEYFYSPGLRTRVTGSYDEIPVVTARLDDYLSCLGGSHAAPEVNAARREVLARCREAAVRQRGVFSLSVPTGGGKTLSAMAFALHHAIRWNLDRVIVVIPYTSIIEQNAAVYRHVLGKGNVIEHHSNLDPERETEWNRLASENWDAPVVVTTSVQFFESLFANRPSRCRKLHSISRSVIILDEVQTLPSGFLAPILEGLSELVKHYGCTVVLSTATQPALRRREVLPEGLEDVHEIVDDPAELHRTLSRVEVQWPAAEQSATDWHDLAQELSEHPQVLCIVHRREDARLLAQCLPAEGTYHLSALMCPSHRSDVLREVTERLERDETCRLVSTQLVEAGVDIDFPVVYRALAGLDSVVQAAGRCNREGRLEKGKVVVFKAPTLPPRGAPLHGYEATVTMLRGSNGQLDLADPAVHTEFFQRLYFKLERDVRNVQRERQELNFATTAAKFKLIEDGFTEPIVVPYGDAAQRLDACRQGVTRDRLRSLQPFLVHVYPGDLERLECAIEHIGETIRAIRPRFFHLYDDRFGLVVDQDIQPDPEELIV